jgi:soluble lytic murein transglycosylase
LTLPAGEAGSSAAPPAAQAGADPASAAPAIRPGLVGTVDAFAAPALQAEPAGPPPRAEPSAPPVDSETLRQAIEAVRKGDVAEADALRQRLPDPAAQALLDWVALRAGVAMSFERIAAFQTNHPDWPVTALIRRRAEEALLANRKSPAVVRAYFAKDAPVTGSGKLALAFALKAEGEDDAALPLVRSAWREDSFGRDLESRVLDAFPDGLTRADHRFRMERFLFRESWVSALRAAAYAATTTCCSPRRGLPPLRAARRPRRRSPPSRSTCAPIPRTASRGRSSCGVRRRSTRPRRRSRT